MKKSRTISNLTILILIVTTVLLNPVIGSQAAVKSGAVCKKVKQVRVVSEVSFRCVKSGKKLVWRKVASAPVVVPAVEVTPSPSPSPTPSTAPTIESTPTSTPTSEAIPLSKNPNFNRILWSKAQGLLGFPIQFEEFQISNLHPSSWGDLYEMRDGIPYAAWEAVGRTMSQSNSKAGKLVVYEGPNSTPAFTDLSQVMDLVSRAFPTAKEVENVNAFVYNFTDRFWANEVYQRIHRDESERFRFASGNAVLENCQVQREVCWAMAFTDSKSNGVMLLGVIEKGSREQLNQTYSEYSRSDLGLVVAHEYFHTIQRRILGDNWFEMQYTPPIWFNEGSAVFVENAVMNHQSFNRYMQFRLVDSKLAYPGCAEVGGGCFTVDSETLSRFFSLTNYQSNWNNFPYGMKYEVSARIIEILVALKGPKSLIDLYDQMAQRRTFEVAFERVYGIPYAEATPIITRILVDQFENQK